VYLYKYVRDKEYEYLATFIEASMVDFIKDESTGKVLKSSPHIKYHLRYLYTFMRKTGVLSKGLISASSCPHCGADVKVSSAGKCEHCGFIVTTGGFNWVLSDIEGIEDGMEYDDGGVVIRG
jgi:ribosomal protein L37AE/L43A